MDLRQLVFSLVLSAVIGISLVSCCGARVNILSKKIYVRCIDPAHCHQMGDKAVNCGTVREKFETLIFHVPGFPDDMIGK